MRCVERFFYKGVGLCVCVCVCVTYYIYVYKHSLSLSMHTHRERERERGNERRSVRVAIHFMVVLLFWSSFFGYFI